MKIAVFSIHRFEKDYFDRAGAELGLQLTYFEARLCEQTVALAEGFEVVCAFVSDRLDAQVLARLKAQGTRLIALRSAGFNNVDLVAAARLGLPVVRVPEYSPYAVAEHAVGLLLSLNRKIHRAFIRVRDLNFSLDGLVGFDVHGKTVGVIGTGRIGTVFARIMKGFGTRVLAYDPQPSAEALALGLEFTSLDELYKQSDIISLHVPLTPRTRHLIDAAALALFRPGAILLNTGRGGLIDTPALITALKDGHLGGAGLDVYEEEEGVFFQDLSESGLRDDVLARLLVFPNVLVTAHQAFLTAEALANIARTTLGNISAFKHGEIVNEVHAETHVKTGKP